MGVYAYVPVWELAAVWARALTSMRVRLRAMLGRTAAIEQAMGAALAGLDASGQARSQHIGGGTPPPDFEENSNKNVHPAAFGFDLWAPIEDDDDDDDSSSRPGGGANAADSHKSTEYESADADDLRALLRERDSRIAALEVQTNMLRANQLQSVSSGSADTLKQEAATLRACLAEVTLRCKELEASAAEAQRSASTAAAARVHELESLVTTLHVDRTRLMNEKDDLENALSSMLAEKLALEAQLELRAAEAAGKTATEVSSEGTSLALQRRLAEIRTASQTYEQKVKKYRRMLVTADNDYKTLEKHHDAVLDRARILARRLGTLFSKAKDSPTLAKSLFTKLDYEALAERLPNVIGVLSQKAKNWNERHVIIKDNFFLAYKARSGAPVFACRLDLAVVEPCAGDPKLEHAFRLRSEETKETIWRANSKRELDQWVDCLVKAVQFLSLDALVKPSRTQLFIEAGAAASSGASGADAMATLVRDDPMANLASRGPSGFGMGAVQTQAAPSTPTTSSGAQALAKPYALADKRDEGACKFIAAL